jgi:hypothetical protein
VRSGLVRDNLVEGGGPSEAVEIKRSEDVEIRAAKASKEK